MVGLGSRNDKCCFCGSGTPPTDSTGAWRCQFTCRYSYSTYMSYDDSSDAAGQFSPGSPGFIVAMVAIGLFAGIACTMLLMYRCKCGCFRPRFVPTPEQAAAAAAAAGVGIAMVAIPSGGHHHQHNNNAFYAVGNAAVPEGYVAPRASILHPAGGYAPLSLAVAEHPLPTAPHAQAAAMMMPVPMPVAVAAPVAEGHGDVGKELPPPYVAPPAANH